MMDQDTKTQTPPGMTRQRHPGRTNTKPLNPWQERPVSAKNSDTPGETRNNDGEKPPAAEPDTVPGFTRWTLRIGGGAALLCGAILSFFALYGLAVMNGWPRYIAWALPGSVDVLTATAIVTAMSVPRHHRGAKVAHWCAAASLLMTVGCNVEYHALLPTTQWTIGHDFLVATGAVPAIVVELILVMQMYLGDGATLATATGTEVPLPAPPIAPLADGEQRHPQAPLDTATGAIGGATETATAGATQGATAPPPAPATSTPQALPSGATEKRATATRKRQPAGATVTDMGASGGLSLEEWAERAAPVYVELMDRNGAAPTAPKLMAELVQRGNPAVGPARARLVRKATEDRLGLSKDADEESEPGDDELQEAS